MKQCTKCKQWKADSEYPECKIKKDGLRNDCKSCTRLYQKKYREEHRIELNEADRKYYQEHKQERRIKDKEYYYRNREELLEQQRKRRESQRPEIKEHLKKYHKKYYQIHKKQLSDDAKKRYYKNKEEIKRKRKDYYYENIDKIREYGKGYHQKNKEKICRSVQEWRQKNPEKHNAWNRKRKLKKKQLFEDFTIEEWTKKVEETQGICPICNKPYSERYPFIATLDHTPSISTAPVGYHYTIKDITPMCGFCNTSKGASL